MHQKNIKTGGRKIEEAEKALIMLHGRGAPAEDILGLASHLAVGDFALFAPRQQITHGIPTHSSFRPDRMSPGFPQHLFFSVIW